MAETLADLVTKFAPRVYFHPSEQYFPAPVYWYWGQVTYVEQSSKDGPATRLTQWQWASVTKGPFDYLSPNSSAVNAGNLAQALTYVHALDVKGVDNEVDLQYWFFYPFNGNETLRIEGLLGIAGEVPLTLSQHAGDWEHVTVRVNTSTNQIVAVYFAQHSWGVWMGPAPSGDPTAGYTLTGGTHPVVYSANGSHACYPSAGGPFLVGGKDLALIEFNVVDYTGQGQNMDVWNPGRFVIVANDSSVPCTQVTPQPWTTFKGLWGPPQANRLSPKHLALAIVQTIKTELPMSAWLTLFLAQIVTPEGLVLLIALGAFLADIIYRRGQEGARNPMAQKSWCRSPAYIAWAKDQGATSQGFDQPALIADADSVICYYSGLMAPVQYSDWYAGKWAGEETIYKSVTLAPIAAIQRQNDVVLVFFDNDDNVIALAGGGSTWTPINLWPWPRNFASGLSLVSFSGLVYCFYLAPYTSNSSLSCITTSDWQTWTYPQLVPGTSLYPSPSPPRYVRPAAAVLGDTLYVAYLQTPIPQETPDLMVVSLSIKNGVSTWSVPVTIAKNASTFSPALVATTKRLVCAFADSSKVVRYTVSVDGTEWADPTALGNAKSPMGPALTVVGTTLMCVHMGTNEAHYAYSTAPA